MSEALGKDRHAYTLLSDVNVQVKLLQLSNFGHSSLYFVDVMDVLLQYTLRCYINRLRHTIARTQGESSKTLSKTEIIFSDVMKNYWFSYWFCSHQL